MKHLPLNATRNFDIWPNLSPNEWLDFNPTIVTLENGQTLAFIRRDRVPPIPGEGTIWSIPLNVDLHPVGTPHLIIPRGEDPRAVVIGERIFLFYVIIEKEPTGKILGSSVILSEFSAEIYPPTLVRSYPLPKNPTGNPALLNTKWEKNWVPFVTRENQIALIYQHAPWTILLLKVEPAEATPEFITYYAGNELLWDYGEIRGGTSPIKYSDKENITFYHSSQVIGSRMIYMVGACVFSNTPPYTPTLMTLEPLLIAPYKSIAARFGWGILASVIFPLGAKHQDGKYKITAGIDDGEIGIFTISESELKNRLAPIQTKSQNTIIASDTTTMKLPHGPTITTTDSKNTISQIPIARFIKMLRINTGTFLDLGTEDGLFPIYLTDCFSKVIAVKEHKTEQTEQTEQTEHNINCNSIANCETHEIESFDFDKLQKNKTNTTLIRINVTNLQNTLTKLSTTIQRDSPIILIRLQEKDGDSKAYIDMLNTHNYDIKHLFQRNPEYVLCIKQKHIKHLQWIL
jgi:predicted GH43/DUF377 family glycosyl hydrolase